MKLIKEKVMRVYLMGVLLSLSFVANKSVQASDVNLAHQYYN